MKQIGWIGTGIMGTGMTRNLLKAGYSVTLTTRTKAKAEPLLAEGASWADTPREVALRSEVVFSIVGYPADVEEVILGDEGVLAGCVERMNGGNAASDAAASDAAAGGGSPPIIVDMTTSQPALAERIAALAAEQGVAVLDAPVSGGDVGAREGTLAIMVGGDEAAYREILPLFEVMGKTIQLMGPAGAGQHTKTVNQILVAGTMISSVEALLYAARAGLDLEEVIGVVGKGAAASWTINNLGMRIARDDMNPGFMIRHFVKDLGIALEESRRMQVSLPGLALVEQFYQAALAEGLEKNGTQALYRVYQRINSA